VLACGKSAPQSAPCQAAAALAARLGQTPVEFPGGHTGWLLRPKGFAANSARSFVELAKSALVSRPQDRRNELPHLVSRLKGGAATLPCMTIELALLAASVVLGIVHIVMVSHLQSWQRSYRWTASSREGSVAPLTGLAGRSERALRNYLESFPFFVAAILVVSVTNTHGWLTVWGAHFYFWGRIVYAILYMADLPLARSLVWNIPTIGILMNVAGLFLK
jgi:uncharacterized MAPEG superfamily protein